ncbi:uncharacterized protein BJ212DRAFT_1312558 [Suillus subaureus]|uniref:PWWP domain-containing protein n=1 Tax=Suillus subaureus TaxID=48587 RepID=A0A9P7JKE0_9AGAM|nr:uncharacterized protein BJ212DRAFT_1312558 [Suillus subaureus]KAG1827471.1 hypothetical protein BJ212DRAFT_1312558 [Suillus subaureus]
MTTTSTSPMLSERILPTRRAASRASAVFANQLHSPGHSDDEPEPSDSFGEPPSRRQPNVKYRYNAKGKFRASPLKQTDNSSPSPKRQPKPKPKTKPKPVTPSHSQVSVRSKKRKASASGSDREGTVSTLTTLSPSPFSSVPTSPFISTTDLPPLSIISHSTPPPQKLSMVGSGSMRSLRVSSSSFSQPRSQTSPRKRKADKAKTTDRGNGRSFGDVDTLVWVLVNDLGIVVTSVPDDDDDIEILDERMWWPARIVQKQPLRVTLFGDLSLSREPSTILSPSEHNIQPIHNLSGEKRFSRATFHVSSLTTSGSSDPSPRKKTKKDTSERWEAAVKAMEDADGLKRDGMPEMISAYTGGTFSSEEDDVEDLRSTKKAKISPRAEPEAPTDRAWSPPPPDPMLQIPGELVLAQALRTRSNKYWPAQLIAYVPPTKPGGKERYRAKFLDEREYNLTRDRFWTSEEEGFVMCDLGEFESAVQDTEAPDSEDEPEDKRRSPSPELTDPPPSADAFADLSMHAQLAYVKPVLNAILQGKYTPASKSHEAFMRGGAARSSLMKRAAVRGGLDPNEVKQSQKLITRWALGEGYARRTNVKVKPEAKVAPPLEQDSTICLTTLTTNGDGLADAAVGSEIVATSDSAAHDISQPIPPSDIGNQDTEAMTVDKPDSGATDETSVASDVAGHHDISQPIPPSDNRQSVGITTALSQPIPPSDTGNKIDGDAVTVDQPSQAGDSSEPKTVDLPSVSLPDQPSAPKEVIAEQPDSSGHCDLPHAGEVESPVPAQDQQRPVGSQEYESLSTLDKLDYCVNILLPEAIQQLLLWRSGERTTAALLSHSEEERLHERGSAKAQETDWVFDLLRLREAQARLWSVDLKVKGKAKDETGVARGGTRSRPRKTTAPR